MLHSATLIALTLAQPEAPPREPEEPRHPIISEVLFAVPTYEGDANRDGTRDATGDEFIELYNPHDTPINLAGYTVSDRNPVDRGRLEFRFPAVVLEPGQCAVVFNGLNADWRGPVGDSTRAAPVPHPSFHDAWVFTLRNESKYIGLSNAADWIMLTSPKGERIACVAWGKLEPPPPIDGAKVDWARDINQSAATRVGTTPDIVSHNDIGSDPDARRAFSPGAHPWPPTNQR